MTPVITLGPVQGGTLSKNKWHHVAACRSGNTIRVFVDGVMYGSGDTINVDKKIVLILFGLEESLMDTGMGIYRTCVVNGTALYTTNFTTSNYLQSNQYNFCAVSHNYALLLP